MKITYDEQADAAYLYIAEGQKAVSTVPATKQINLDFDAEGRLIGVEVLDAKKLLPKGLV